MALATTAGIEHIDMGQRPQYGQPYPEGIAVVSSRVADDASGGAHTFSFNADPGFLYRLELFNYTRGEATLRNTHCITTHRWATGKVPFDNLAFDLNWAVRAAVVGSAFAVYTIQEGPAAGTGISALPQIRRFPMGATLGGGAPGVSVQLMLVTMETNTDTITNELVAVWTYWKKESLYLPGFLSAFYEAPAVPPLLRLPA